MHIINFTVKQADKIVGEVAIREQAVNAAKARAQQTGCPVAVIAHLDTGKDRTVIFNPDGTNERIWAIDKGARIQPVIGQVYTNRGGGQYRCIAPADDGPMFYNAVGGFSNSSGVFQNIKSGWTFTAKGIIQYIDGTIEWDHSVGGHFEKVTPRKWTDRLREEVYNRLAACSTIRADLPELVAAKWATDKEAGKEAQGYTKEDAVVSVLELMDSNGRDFELTIDEYRDLCAE